MCLIKVPKAPVTLISSLFLPFFFLFHGASQSCKEKDSQLQNRISHRCEEASSGWEGWRVASECEVVARNRVARAASALEALTWTKMLETGAAELPVTMAM